MCSDLDAVMDPGFELFDQRDATETQATISSRKMKTRANKARTISAMKKETLGDLLQELPGPGEYYHIVSNGRFDYFTFLPVILDRVHHITELYGSTWTMNRQNVTDLLEYIDQGRIDQVTVISGLYFKRRETSVYATLLQGLTKRRMRYLSCENHAKVMLLRSADAWYVIEGSANWTANPRIEQNIVVNSEQVYLFHRDWMESLMRRA